MRLLLDMINWSFYNKSLVRRGEVILDFDVIDSWYSELDIMNDGKRGGRFTLSRFVYPITMLYEAYFHLPYRQAEGVVDTLMLVIRYHLFQTTVQLTDVLITRISESANDMK